MKKLFWIALLSIAITSFAYGQDEQSLVVTSEDVEIRFLEDPTEQWRPVVLLSVTYSLGPVGAHKRIVKLGEPQVWEGSIDKEDPGRGKAVMLINMDSLPTPSWRAYEFRWRVRETTDNPWISPYSEPNDVRVAGNPGKANQTK